MDASSPRSRPGRGILGWVVTAVFTLVALAAIAAPVAVYRTTAASNSQVDREGAPEVELPEADIARYQDVAKGSGPTHPLILSYHDVRSDPPEDDRYTVTPEQFAEHMAMLDAAGFQTIGTRELVAHLDGTAPLPPRSVMITFDDGTTGLWRHADAVLERHGFSAVAFVITGRIGSHRPYYLNEGELTAMHETGRWQMESHTRDGHDRVLVDAAGTEEPFLINRMWLEGKGRMESIQGLVDRVRRDLAGSVRDLEELGFPRPRLFAYPFSAETNPTNDPAAPARVATVVDELFAAGMTNVEPDRLVNERDRLRRSLPRLEVFRETTAPVLFERIRAARPVSPGPARPLEHPGSWTDSAGRSVAPAAAGPEVPSVSPHAEDMRFDAGTLTIDAADGFRSASLSPGRSPDWTSYAVTALARGLDPGGDGATASLFALQGSDQEIQVAVSATFVRVAVGAEPARKVVAEHRLRPDEVHALGVTIHGDTATVTVDGDRIATVGVAATSTGGVGLGASSGMITFTRLGIEDMAGAGTS